MTESRTYRPRRQSDDAPAERLAEAGHQFAPAAVSALIAMTASTVNGSGASIRSADCGVDA